MRRAGGWVAGLALCAAACGDPALDPPRGAAAEWPHYGNDAGGLRYSPLPDVTPENVGRLQEAWHYRHGDVSDGRGAIPSTSAFEVTPIVVDETLFFCTPFNRVIALDPETGEERWVYDPEIELEDARYANQLICRGVSTWLDPERVSGEECRRRILTGTNDARLIALDAATGRPCSDFGEAGQVDLNPGVGQQKWRGEYQVTSPPVVSGDVVVVGSAVSDNQRVDAPSGVVRGFDVRTGALRWAWDLAPPDFERSPENTSSAGYVLGTPNVWAPMSVDVQRDLVFVPTGNPAPDYFHGDSTLAHYGSSVVALRGATGEVVWSFQTVHHDLWDFDVPAQPTLFDLRRDGRAIPALVQATKMGFLFILNRETGEPLFPIRERPVPQIHVTGERLSPTQPFPVKPEPLAHLALSPRDAWGLTPWDRAACREKLESLRFEGMYTPPTLEGTLMFPGNAGGMNWGGVAVDPARQIVVANLQNFAWSVTLFPSEEYAARRKANPHAEIAPQHGTPYGMRRDVLLSPLGVPCNPPPWGELAAVDLSTGDLLWKVKLGTLHDVLPIPLPIRLGVPNLGGPLVTAGGVVFIAAAITDDHLRAFDLATGEELHKWRLPAGGQATPMTYRAREDGPQYVVMPAGGYGRGGSTLGDSLIAYRLQ